MSRFVAACGVAVALLLCAVAAVHAGEQPNEIPLNSIWAWRIPGTKDVGTLDASKINGVTEHPILHDLYAGVGLLPKGKRADSAFVVEGEGKTALLNARAVFKKQEGRRELLPANTELSLVFYSHSISSQVQLVSVDKSASLITVKYRFLTHGLPAKKFYFALIPIGKFAPGTVQVKIEQQDAIDLAGNRKPPIQRLERLISGGLTFEVRK